MVQAVGLIAGAGQAGRLVVAVHHLSVDGVSWRMLMPDLAAAGRRWPRAPAGACAAGTSFRRWAQLLAGAAGRQQAAGELAWWQQVLDGGDPCWRSRPLGSADTAGGDAADGGAVAADLGGY